MKFSKRSIGIFTALVLATGLSAGTMACEGKMKHMDPDKKVERMSKKLDLTDTQQTQVRAIIEQKHASMMELKEQAKALREQGMDRKAIHEQLKPQHKAIHDQAHAQLSAVLNESQLKKFEKHRMKKMKNHEKHMKKHMEVN